MNIKLLQNTFSRPGIVEAITVRSQRVSPVSVLDAVIAIRDKGLAGDHYQNNGGSRQVTLIQCEHLDVVASLLGTDHISPELVRRNIVVRGLNLLSLKGKQFFVGPAILQYTGECHPCSRMERVLGIGGYNAMRGHGGITAKIICGGLIKVGDAVNAVTAQSSIQF